MSRIDPRHLLVAFPLAIAACSTPAHLADSQRGTTPVAPSTSPATTTATAPAAKLSPDILPGNGLAQHDFLYTGEWDTRRNEQVMSLVRGGKVVWTYSIPLNDPNGVLEELGDATMLPNGNIAFCRKIGFSVITPEKKILWSLEAPKNTEMHSIQPINADHVLIVQSGNPAKIMTVNILNGQVEKEVTLPTGKPDTPHMQFRRVRLTAAGTYLAGHLDMNKVSEYDATGKEIWTVAAFQPWSVVRLKNGNTLVGCSNQGVKEFNPAGETVWSFSQKDCPDIRLFIIQEVSRLANGNTLLCNWCPNGLKDKKDWPNSVQVLEVTPDKKVVWALRSWSGDADLGPASSIQLLDSPGLQR